MNCSTMNDGSFLFRGGLPNYRSNRTQIRRRNLCLKALQFPLLRRNPLLPVQPSLLNLRRCMGCETPCAGRTHNPERRRPGARQIGQEGRENRPGQVMLIRHGAGVGVRGAKCRG